MKTYRALLAIPAVRQAVWIGLLMRIPLWAGQLVLMLHVVQHLGRGYGAAGLVTTMATVALSISAPWRGRLIDRLGLRRTLLPSLVILTAVWCVAPWVPYWWLAGLAAVAGLYALPTFSVVRQVMLQAVPLSGRTAVLSLDSVAVEISFMAGPAMGIILATLLPTGAALMVCELLCVLGGLILYLKNPALTPQEHDAPAHHGARWWRSLAVVAVLAASFATNLLLTGTELSIVASLRKWGRGPDIGWVLALWGLGSAVGGLVYGAMSRTLSAFWLLAGLSLTTLPIALTTDLPLYVALIVLSGIFCAPTITATVDALSRVVPAANRGEALGVHGSALTAGSALGAPVVGTAIDRYGFSAGFLVSAGVGLAFAAVGLALVRLSRRR